MKTPIPLEQISAEALAGPIPAAAREELRWHIRSGPGWLVPAVASVVLARYDARLIGHLRRYATKHDGWTSFGTYRTSVVLMWLDEYGEEL